jgi:hypothetical protein
MGSPEVQEHTLGLTPSGGPPSRELTTFSFEGMGTSLTTKCLLYLPKKSHDERWNMETLACHGSIESNFGEL